MARKRRRRKLKPGPFVWLFLIVNVIAGLLLSPITAAQHVRVIGAKPDDISRISRELSWLKGKPCITVNGGSVEEQIYRRPDVRSVSLSRNVLGRGELQVSYYEPVALVTGTKNVVLTREGFLCAMQNAPPNLPALILFANTNQSAASPDFSFSSNWEPGKVADVCERAITQGIVKNLSIAVTVNGYVCLNSGVTGRVVLGSPDDLDEKFDKIKTILSAQPSLLSQGKELVLTTPAKPVTRPYQGMFQ